MGRLGVDDAHQWQNVLDTIFPLVGWIEPGIKGQANPPLLELPQQRQQIFVETVQHKVPAEMLRCQKERANMSDSVFIEA